MIAFLIVLFALTLNPSPSGGEEKIWLPSPAGRGVGGEGSAGADILFPAGEKVARLRIAATVDEQAPDAAWESFLDKLFDYFDRDGDGFLSATEAARVFPLPLPGGRETKMDFAKLDSDRDGKGSRAEFRAFYRAIGFTPVVVVIRPAIGDKPDPKWIDHQQLGNALFRHLDRDGDGKLTRAELEKASGLLRRLDENEDELLTPAELLAVGMNGSVNVEASSLKAATIATDAVPDAVLHLAFGKNSGPPKLESKLDTFRVRDKAGRAFGFRVPDGHVTVSTVSDVQEGFHKAKGFYLAQLTAALGSKAAMSKGEVEADPSLQALAAMFDVADRNGDGKLTPTELRAFLDLVELGVSCQVVIAVEDRGRNLFDLLDTNQDGVLDFTELNRAAQVCEEVSRFPLTPTTIPHQFQLSALRASVDSTFGPVSLPTSTKPKAPLITVPARGPKWFQAMDRNGDGFVSPMEFIGPPELFRKLDTNGDGRISVEEAEAARQ